MQNRYSDSPAFKEDLSLLSQIPRVATIHDLSCFGRCALTVIIPILSVMGIQAIPLPTALLSTHTGGFENMHFKDLSKDMEQISLHWEKIGMDFDAIYSGFLGSEQQIDTVIDFTAKFRTKNNSQSALVMVDPVMGDDGVLYSTYNKKLVEGVKRLCFGADIITPNMTEACFLTDTPYPLAEISGNSLDEKGAKSFAELLAERLEKSFGCKKIVITGIAFEGNITTAAFDSENGKVKSEHFYTSPLLPRAYPGTGDVFSSTLLGFLLAGKDFFDSARFASDYVRKVIEISQHYKTPIRDGVIIEPCLADIILK